MAKPEVVVATALIASFVLGLIGGRWGTPRPPRYTTQQPFADNELSTTLNPSVGAKSSESATTEGYVLASNTSETVPSVSFKGALVIEAAMTERSVKNVVDTYLGPESYPTAYGTVNTTLYKNPPHIRWPILRIGSENETGVAVEQIPSKSNVTSRENFLIPGNTSNYEINSGVGPFEDVSNILIQNITSQNETGALTNYSFQSTPETYTTNLTLLKSVKTSQSTSTTSSLMISEVCPMQDVDYVKMGQELVAEAITMLDSGIWDFERRTEDGDVIFSRVANGTTVYRLTGIVDMAAQDLLVIIYDGLADYPKWNPTLLECRVLEKINDQTDIAYTVSAPGARGYVASRDFISLRHWDIYQNTFVAATKSIDFLNAPSNPDYIRGQNGAGCMELRLLSSDPLKTEFRWLLNTKLNGWIPTYIADKAYKKFMTKYMVFLREYCKKVKQRTSEALTPAGNQTTQPDR